MVNVIISADSIEGGENPYLDGLKTNWRKNEFHLDKIKTIKMSLSCFCPTNTSYFIFFENYVFPVPFGSDGLRTVSSHSTHSHRGQHITSPCTFY